MDTLRGLRCHIYGPGFKPDGEQTDYANPRLWAYSIGYDVGFPILSVMAGLEMNGAVDLVIDVIIVELWRASGRGGRFKE